jgi:hypothetical protein
MKTLEKTFLKVWKLYDLGHVTHNEVIFVLGKALAPENVHQLYELGIDFKVLQTLEKDALCGKELMVFAMEMTEETRKKEQNAYNRGLKVLREYLNGQKV